MMKNSFVILFLFFAGQMVSGQKDIVDYVNPFIGTSNFGTTNPYSLRITQGFGKGPHLGVHSGIENAKNTFGISWKTG